VSGSGPIQPGRARPADESVYVPSSGDGELRQCEILSNVVQAYLPPESVAASTAASAGWVVNFKLHSLALVMSQDCDLEQDFRLRATPGKDPSLPNVLFCEVFEAARTEEHMKEQRSEDLWRRVFQNQDPRYQYLRAAASTEDTLGEGLPAMVVDFKRYFTLPTDEVYGRLRIDTRRRCLLNGCYAQHLAHRFYSFHSRVAIPVDHHH
jgi:hypothetical protein